MVDVLLFAVFGLEVGALLELLVDEASLVAEDVAVASIFSRSTPLL